MAKHLESMIKRISQYLFKTIFLKNEFLIVLDLEEYYKNLEIYICEFYRIKNQSLLIFEIKDNIK